MEMVQQVWHTRPLKGSVGISCKLVCTSYFGQSGSKKFACRLSVTYLPCDVMRLPWLVPHVVVSHRIIESIQVSSAELLVLQVPTGYRPAMLCDPDLATAIATANQDHRLDGYLGEAFILILIVALARSHDHMLAGLPMSTCSWACPMNLCSWSLAHEHTIMLMGQAHDHMPYEHLSKRGTVFLSNRFRWVSGIAEIQG